MTPVIFQRLESTAVLIAALILYAGTGWGWGVFALLILAPDIFMVGYLDDARLGALLYNLGHFYLMPALCLGLWRFAGMDWGLPLGAIWMAHIAMDRTLGYGLKLDTGFKHTHLGNL